MPNLFRRTNMLNMSTRKDFIVALIEFERLNDQLKADQNKRIILSQAEKLMKLERLTILAEAFRQVGNDNNHPLWDAYLGNQEKLIKVVDLANAVKASLGEIAGPNIPPLPEKIFVREVADAKDAQSLLTSMNSSISAANYESRLKLPLSLDASYSDDGKSVFLRGNIEQAKKFLPKNAFSDFVEKFINTQQSSTATASASSDQTVTAKANSGCELENPISNRSDTTPSSTLALTCMLSTAG